MNLATLYEEVSNSSFLLSISRVIDHRPIAFAESCKNTTEPSRQTSHLFCRKHVFYKVWLRILHGMHLQAYCGYKPLAPTSRSHSQESCDKHTAIGHRIHQSATAHCSPTPSGPREKSAVCGPCRPTLLLSTAGSWAKEYRLTSGSQMLGTNQLN